MEAQPPGVNEEGALNFDHSGEGVGGRGTGTCSRQGDGGGSWGSAVGAEPVDPSNGPVFWKATIVECHEVMLGVTGNAQIAGRGFSDPATFGWYNADANVMIAGKPTDGHGGWAAGNLQAGDVKLEAHQLSLRVQRLGAQTFTVPTNGVQNLRVFACLYPSANRVQLSRAGAGEEY